MYTLCITNLIYQADSKHVNTRRFGVTNEGVKMICVVCGKRFEAEEDVCQTCREIVKNKRTLKWFRKMRDKKQEGGENENEIQKDNRCTCADDCAGHTSCQCSRSKSATKP